MAKTNINIQDYIRIKDTNSKFIGYFDDSKYKHHTKKIYFELLKNVIRNAIKEADKKSSRRILDIADDATENEIQKLLAKSGKDLFAYFKKYCGDPASTAHDCYNIHYSVIAQEQFRNRTLQKERMNSGWRYQFIVLDAANLSKRFSSISDLGLEEADFNAVLNQLDGKSSVSIYASVKNRGNTMGGQDWPKAIAALEKVANTDKNRKAPYICVFGIAMERGLRNIKRNRKSNLPYSNNTEVWLSDFFWPFFTNYSYEEITKAVLDVIMESKKKKIEFEVPKELIESFGECCRANGLLDERGIFNDPYKIVEVFCRPKTKENN